MDTKPEVKSKTVKFDVLVVESANNVADVDDVINVLNVLENSDKTLNFFDKPAATDYLKAAGLISEPEPNQFKVENLQACKDLNDHLSHVVEDLIAKASTPDVLFNSSVVEQK